MIYECVIVMLLHVTLDSRYVFLPENIFTFQNIFATSAEFCLVRVVDHLQNKARRIFKAKNSDVT